MCGQTRATVRMDEISADQGRSGRPNDDLPPEDFFQGRRRRMPFCSPPEMRRRETHFRAAANSYKIRIKIDD